MIKILRAFFLFIPFIAYGQFTYVVDQTIPFQEEKGVDLTAPWVGGLNAAQYNTMDLNNDGKEDLVLFDRMANKLITFLNISNTYQYAPEYEAFFPAEIERWVLLRDFNCDGRKDLFTGDALGIKVYRNVAFDGVPQWEKVLFSTGFPGSKSEVLLTKGNSGKINLQLQYDDLPSISDVDGDGDLDIFSVRFGGSGTIEFHKNFGVERFGKCDSLDFELVTQHWGGVTECQCGQFSFHGHDCSHSGGRTQHAGGKSLLAIDVDGDSNQDILLSEAECARLFLLKNEGTVLNPEINTATAFPETLPANFLIYPSGYYEDLDFDGKKDLMVTPNVYGKTFLNMNFRESNWFYKNTGSNTTPNFVFAKRNFLQETMLDVGDNAVPAFADYDGDGDYDLFISNNNLPGTIRLYENTGTSANPQFTFKNDDFLSLSFLSLFNLRIQFADINSDNKIDLVFLARSYQTGTTKIYYMLNNRSAGFDFSQQNVQELTFTIASTENFLVTDVDRDGKADLLIGRSNGSLEYWRNTGGLNFILENQNYLGIGSSVVRQNLSGAVGDLDADGNEDLILGDQTGELRLISNFRNATSINEALTDIVFNPINNSYTSQNLGGRVWPVVVNLFNTDKPSIVAGTSLGGLRVLRNDEGEPLSATPKIFIYPNPVSKNDVAHVRIDRPSFLEIYNINGARVREQFFLHANTDMTLQFSNFAPGVYVLRFIVNNKSFSKRLVVY